MTASFLITPEEWGAINHSLPDSTPQAHACEQVHYLLMRIVNSVTARIQLTAAAARDAVEGIARDTASLLNVLATEGAEIASPENCSWDTPVLTPLGCIVMADSRLNEVVENLVSLRNRATQLAAELRHGGRELVLPLVNIRDDFLKEASEIYYTLTKIPPSTTPLGGFFGFSAAVWMPGYRLVETRFPEQKNQLPETISRDAVNRAVADWRKRHPDQRT